MTNKTEEQFHNFIDNALREDLGDGDHTSLACIPSSAIGSARLLIKENGILAGTVIAETIFKQVDAGLKIESFMRDGDQIKKGDVVFTVTGSAQSILQAERLVLNCMQRMSGIATHTRSFVNKIEGLPCKILDTRKTTPGFRMLEKWAVRIGGGYNHRQGLYDMIMIKDNHIDCSGGIEAAIKKTVKYLKETGKDLKIEIEARNLTEVDIILKTGNVHRIMLDNFNYDDLRTAVRHIDREFETEASGGINLNTVRQYAECGVDYISVGALTHQINSLDMSLKAKLK